MKHDLTTGTWQDDPGCPISIILVTTSDVIARPPSKMVAETASNVDGGRQNNTNRLTTY
jgi:hypothetical protein